METDIDFSQWGRGFIPAEWSELTFGEASSIEEYAFLFGLSALLRPKKILEIGTSQGLGTIALLSGARMTGTCAQITTIDKTRYDFDDNLALFFEKQEGLDFRLGDSGKILQDLFDQEAFFDLCFIDGGHRYDIVSKDWSVVKKMSDTFLFHDTSSEKGVSKLINEIKKDTNFSVLSLEYNPGHKLDEYSQEWYKILVSPGMTMVRKRS